MNMRPVTQKKIEYGARILMKEFETLPGDQVEAEVRSVAAALLDHARFDDYVPILAHRFAREHLRERMTQVPLAQAA